MEKFILASTPRESPLRAHRYGLQGHWRSQRHVLYDDEDKMKKYCESNVLGMDELIDGRRVDKVHSKIAKMVGKGMAKEVGSAM